MSEDKNKNDGPVVIKRNENIKAYERLQDIPASYRAKVLKAFLSGTILKPAVTPVDPDGFELVIRAHLHGLAELRAQSAFARLTARRTPVVPPQREVAAIVPEPTTRVPS